MKGKAAPAGVLPGNHFGQDPGEVQEPGRGADQGQPHQELGHHHPGLFQEPPEEKQHQSRENPGVLGGQHHQPDHRRHRLRLPPP